MPGSIFFDHDADVKSHIYQTPQTPSASTYLEPSAASFISHDTNQHTSRKRLRQCSYELDRKPKFPLSNDVDREPTAETPTARSPAPLVNTKYTLAGGLDTPTIAFTLGIENAVSPDLNVRGGRGWHVSAGASPGSYFPPLAREGNGRPRQYRPIQPDSWSRTIYNVFGVAGKFWEFCKANTFRGFYAGGGPGYRMQPVKEESIWQSYNEKDDISQSWEKENSVPGSFADKDFIADYMSRDHMTPGRPPKRLLMEKGGDLSSSWVMLGATSSSREPSPTRLTARKVPSKASTGRKPTSKAGQRPILSASRPSQTSLAGSPALRSKCPASFAPSRSPLPSPKRSSPVSADVQRHAARIRKRELEEDANLRRFNQQLKAMIKEGKQALGTKIEVEDDSDSVVDEGYDDGSVVDNDVKY